MSKRLLFESTLCRIFFLLGLIDYVSKYDEKSFFAFQDMMILSECFFQLGDICLGTRNGDRMKGTKLGVKIFSAETI